MEVNFLFFFVFFLAKMASNRPSSEWGLSPVNERWFVIRMVAILSNQLRQFDCYNVYKDDSHCGVELFNSVHNKILKCCPNMPLYYDLYMSFVMK